MESYKVSQVATTGKCQIHVYSFKINMCANSCLFINNKPYETYDEESAPQFLLAFARQVPYCVHHNPHLKQDIPARKYDIIMPPKDLSTKFPNLGNLLGCPYIKQAQNSHMRQHVYWFLLWA